jgi:1-pyrroline-5-carboxylate dehydrogenase
MSKGVFNVPFPVNEPVMDYAPGSPEREELEEVYHEMYHQDPIEIPMYIGSEDVYTDDKRPISPPHEHAKILGHFNMGGKEHVEAAIKSALEAREACG